MNYFKTTYELCNFGFGTKVTQTFDVVFEINETECTDENRTKFDNAAHKAASKQIPKFDYKNSGLPLGEGWSSMMGGYTYTRLHLPWLKRKLQKPAPGKPVIACAYTVLNSWDKGVSRYRATGFYKLIKDPYKPDKVMADVFPELLKPRWKVVHCLPKEAQIISGCGIAGSLDVISDVTVGDLVGWSETKIKQEQWEYEQKVKRKDADMYQSDFRSYLPEWTKKLGLTLNPE
jgi:hypothetical protein